ncbi:hypothetical protein [Foetidibacter luteolus]|uniref:hypothetical protein n=1 Tax=Foetidibacter luteolus TaxID=2608880 RepID=UPI00129BD243|nr:hypothetical protein [Foetidibacter luteolus]
MSNYSKFLNELNSFYIDRKAKGLVDKIANDEALAVIRDKWMREGKLAELISFIHTNWDSGNCDDFIEPLQSLLISTNQVELFITLWTKIIKYRLTALWTSLSDLRKQENKINLTEIVSIDTSNFNMFSKDSYKDLKKVVAFRRWFAIDGLTKVQKGLLALNQIEESEKIINIMTNVRNLKSLTFKL